MPAIKKFTDYNALTGAVLRGNETFLMADAASTGTVTAATISFDSATKTISDSAGGLPVAKVGSVIQVSGSAGNTGLFTVASSDANNLVTNEALADEAAGPSVTVAEVTTMYQISADEFAAFVGAAGLPDPLTGHTFKNSRITAHTATSSTLNSSDGNYQTRTAAGNETIELAWTGPGAQYIHVVIIPGAHTISLGASIDKWLGSAPSSIGAEHHLLFFTPDGGTTTIGCDLDVAA